MASDIPNLRVTIGNGQQKTTDENLQRLQTNANGYLSDAHSDMMAMMADLPNDAMIPAGMATVMIDITMAYHNLRMIEHYRG